MTTTSPIPLAASEPAGRAPWLYGIGAAAVCLAFAAFTGHIWEDYFITFRASHNLAAGHGLVFQPGQRVHSFTSPLGTLLPALFALGGGDDVALRAIWGLRLVSAFVLGWALHLAIGTFLRSGLARIAIVSIGSAWVLDPKIVDFSVNGMETALVVAFATATWHAFVSGARLWPCAIGFAGLQWTRPDGCVYFVAIALAWMLWGDRRAAPSWRERILRVIGSGIAGGLLYLPWFVFAWVYYGSPVPHTIIAKAQHHSPAELIGLLASYPWRLLFAHTRLHDLFLPTAYYLGGWPEGLAWAARMLAVGGALAWIWPRVAPAGRVASGALFLGGFYVAYIPGFPWYFPGWQAIALLAWAYLLDALWHARPRAAWAERLPRSIVRIGAALLVLLQAGLFACTAWEMRMQQALIENGHRREVGRWLAQHAATGESVFVECLGYIGYYSGLKMLDCPGLASPEVVAARRAGHQTFAQIISHLRPDWLVLRPAEAQQAQAESAAVREGYRLVRVFDVSPAVEAVPFLPGRGYLRYDAAFLIYRRSP
jgi:hypothetical protein